MDQTTTVIFIAFFIVLLLTNIALSKVNKRVTRNARETNQEISYNYPRLHAQLSQSFNVIRNKDNEEINKNFDTLIKLIKENQADNESFQVAVMYLAEKLGYKFDTTKEEFTETNKGKIALLSEQIGELEESLDSTDDMIGDIHNYLGVDYNAGELPKLVKIKKTRKK